MNINIYLKEMKRNKKLFLICGIIMFSLILFTLALYPSMVKANTDLEGLFKAFPEEMLKALSMDVELFSNILGFYMTYTVFYSMLFGSIYTIMLASSIVSKEENEKTAEFLLTKPVTRMEVVNSKILAFISYTILMNVIVIISSYGGIELFKSDSDYSIRNLFIFIFYSFLLNLSFGAIGLFLSVLVKRGRPIIGLSIGIVIAAYFIEMMSKIVDTAEGFGYISPFKFVNLNIISASYSIELWRLLYLVGVPLVLIIITSIIYQKKDIYV